MKTQALLILALGLAAANAADERPSQEARLRDALRASAIQVRDALAERDALAASHAALEAEKKALTDRIAAADEAARTDRAALETARAAIAEQTTRIEATRADLTRVRDEAARATRAAADANKELAAARERIALLGRETADQRVKNAEMFALGMEILRRYERFGLGTALAAREPFVGTTRVKLENLVQDYADKLDEQRIRP